MRVLRLPREVTITRKNSFASITRRTLSTSKTQIYATNTKISKLAFKTIAIGYGLLTMIPTTFLCLGTYERYVKKDLEKANAWFFFSYTGFISLPLSVVLLCLSPLSLICDFYDRILLNKVQVFWASKSLSFFIPENCIQVSGLDALVKELKNNNKRNVIIVANHSSFLDIYALFYAFSKLMNSMEDDISLRFISKKEIFFIPLVGWVMFLIGHQALNRKSKESGKSVLSNCENLLQNASNVGLIFFAEGTRQRNGVIGEFKNGAFLLQSNLGPEANIPIVPITIVGNNI